jgi:hypothetical protein
VFASLVLSVDGTPYKFAREIDEKGGNAYHINDVPAKAKEFDQAVAALIDKDAFLASYTPSYFFGLHWTKQRELIMKHTTTPARVEVLRAMCNLKPNESPDGDWPNAQAANLAELLKKHSLDDLQKIHGGTGGQKSKLEKAHIAAQSKTKTLAEQLARLPETAVDVETTKAESAKLLEQIKTIEQTTNTADESNRKIIALDNQIKALLTDRDNKKRQYTTLKAEVIPDTCRVCKQPLEGESVKAAEEEKQKRVKVFEDDYVAIVAKRKVLEAERAELAYIDVSEQIANMRALEHQRDTLEDSLHANRARESLQAEVEKARADETRVLADLKESIFILDAVKAYQAKEAELQADKVQSLFTTLSVRLFDHVKSTGEYKPAFEIQMDGKNYSALSAGEKIAAGLELTEVLLKQSDLITPVFIDGIGEYTGKVAVYGQLITARAVPDKDLRIETEGEPVGN